MPAKRTQTRGGRTSRLQLTAQIGVNVRDARHVKALPLADVARDAGISVATLSRIENGKQPVGAALLVVLAGILGVPAASLLSCRDDDGGADVPLASAARTLPDLLDAALEQLTSARDKLAAAQAKVRKRGR